VGLKARYNRVGDELIVKQEGCQIINSKESEGDCNLILNYDRAGKTVGIHLLNASDLEFNPEYVDDYPLPESYKTVIRQALQLNTP